MYDATPFAFILYRSLEMCNYLSLDISKAVTPSFI